MCHNIGYVKGLCKGDKDGSFATVVDEGEVEISPACSDEALAQYDVDRNKLFVRKRFAKGLLWKMAKVMDAEVNNLLSSDDPIPCA